MEAMEKVMMIGCDLHDKSMLLKIAVDRGAAEKSSVVNSPFRRKGNDSQA